MKIDLLVAALLLAALWTGAAVPAAAQVHIFSFGLSGGVAGSIDEDGGGFSNTTFQARFAMETEAHTNLAIRVGRMDFADTALSLVINPTIDYLTISGEYLFSESGYESGFFIGLGYYDLAGDRLAADPLAADPLAADPLAGDHLDITRADENGIGLQVGAVGEFRVTDRVFVFADAAFHYISLDAAQIFGDLQIGLGFRF